MLGRGAADWEVDAQEDALAGVASLADVRTALANCGEAQARIRGWAQGYLDQACAALNAQTGSRRLVTDGDMAYLTSALAAGLSLAAISEAFHRAADTETLVLRAQQLAQQAAGDGDPVHQAIFQTMARALLEVAALPPEQRSSIAESYAAWNAAHDKEWFGTYQANPDGTVDVLEHHTQYHNPIWGIVKTIITVVVDIVALTQPELWPAAVALHAALAADDFANGNILGGILNIAAAVAAGLDWASTFGVVNEVGEAGATSFLSLSVQEAADLARYADYIRAASVVTGGVAGLTQAAQHGDPIGLLAAALQVASGVVGGANVGSGSGSASPWALGLASIGTGFGNAIAQGNPLAAFQAGAGIANTLALSGMFNNVQAASATVAGSDTSTGPSLDGVTAIRGYVCDVPVADATPAGEPLNYTLRANATEEFVRLPDGSILLPEIFVPAEPAPVNQFVAWMSGLLGSVDPANWAAIGQAGVATFQLAGGYVGRIVVSAAGGAIGTLIAPGGGTVIGTTIAGALGARAGSALGGAIAQALQNILAQVAQVEPITVDLRQATDSAIRQQARSRAAAAYPAQVAALEQNGGTYQVHHLVPIASWRQTTPALFGWAQAGGWDINDVGNLLPMPGNDATVRLTEQLGHFGSHSQYSSQVDRELRLIEFDVNQLDPSDRPAAAAQLLRELQDKMRSAITIWQVPNNGTRLTRIMTSMGIG